MLNLLRRYWAVDALAVVFLLVVVLFGAYLNDRQHLSNARVERQRQAICAILANIPGQVPSEIANARKVFASANDPTGCAPLRPVPQPTIILRETPVGGGRTRTVIVEVIPTPTRQSPHPSVKPTPSRSPSPTPKPSPSSTPRPSPSPSPTCLLVVCIKK